MTQKLVGSTHPDWHDMSPFVVHFTKKSAHQSEYDNSISILSERRVEARNRFGSGKNYAESPKCVCFSEVPLHQLKRLADKRGSYGIGFRKDFIVARAGGPIMYAYQDTPHALALRAMIQESVGDPESPVWKIAPFVDQPGLYGSASYFFEWEREWRIVGDLSFEESDPAFLIIPEGLHDAAKAFFEDAEQEQLGPSYKCPFIDPYWSLEQVNSVLFP
ncbi:abortive infection system antitoxin AbiGi family protein [Altererythrobacter sp. H2]|uniref:abortive infection system antitoxin AbiGi family protein n=1 Tax=Altererythrobacter sp. H2 TaxID=3108391 RepID=UPI002B4C18A2|nr:abortive infection system antitoxin AbiGi family protein [Altererythrobacter sp. H2]WRK95786.1 abortive infection system antitoxin AbiGi family protein [Altererythrobacter sp. H2]